MITKQSSEEQIQTEVVMLLDKGFDMQSEGRLSEAVRCYKKILRLVPDIDLVLSNLGYVYFLQNKNEEAEKILQRAIEVSPKFPNSYFNLGLVYKKLSRFDEGIAIIKRGLKIDSQNKFALIDLGILLITVGRYQEAVEVLKRALSISKEPVIYDLLGEAFRLQHKYDEALLFYKLVIKMSPKHAKAYADIGLVWRDKGDYVKAIKYLLWAVKIESKWQYLFYLGDTYRLDKKFLNAILVLKRGLRLNPKSEPIMNCLADCYRNLCDFESSEKLEKIIDRLDIATPYLSLLITEDPKKNLEAAQREVDRYRFLIDRQKEIEITRDKKAKIRLGYFSADFNDGPVAHLISGIFALHDRSKFEVIIYSYGVNDGSVWRKRIERGCDRFVDMENKSDKQIINQIRNDKVDILIDLMGHSKNSRLGLLSHRLAPVQITYLGFPGSTGADYVDYLIADSTVVPYGEEEYFSEKILRMKECFLAIDTSVYEGKEQFTRSQFGLSENAFVYSSFVNMMKIDKKVFRVWMNILKKVPNGVLWLLNRSVAKENLQKEAKRFGVSPNRLVFSPLIGEKRGHLARLGLSDISLDTLVYGGHTTTVDLLIAGVAVLTLKGDHFASRVAASVLKASGLGELIVDNLKTYEELAVALGNNPKKLREIKEKLSLNKMNKNIFKPQVFVKELEDKYLSLI